MRILQIIQRNQLRGAEIFACQLSEQLIRMGFEVDILVLFGNDSGLLKFDLPFYYLNANEKKGWLDIAGYINLNLFIRNGHFDLVQANAGDTFRYAALSKLLFRWKSRLVFRNANQISDFMTSASKKAVYSLLMHQASGIASVSQLCLNDFSKVFSGYKGTKSCLPIGVKIPSAHERVRRDRTFPIAKPLLLHVGSFVPEKNHRGLLRIFLKLRNEFPNAKLVLAGDGKEKSFIEEWVVRDGLGDVVTFAAPGSNIMQLMNKSDVLLLPSITEGLPAVILEAFAAGLPVVAYNTGGIREVIIDKQTGRLISKHDEEGFSVAVRDLLLRDYSLIVENAYQLVSGIYSIEKAAEGFGGVYRTVFKEERKVESKKYEV